MLLCIRSLPYQSVRRGFCRQCDDSLVGNVFGFKALRALRLEDVRFPIAYVKTCGEACRYSS